MESDKIRQADSQHRIRSEVFIFMNYIIFGGTGFIGTHLIRLLKHEVVTDSDKIYALDIVMPGEEGVVPGVVRRFKGVKYIRCDVRKPIDVDIDTTKDDIIFNLAAVHRTPGHEPYEYFETNIRGAENVTAYAEKAGIQKILFTSSIAPYGPAEELKTEESLPTPETPYGISKLTAEKIHEIWQARDPVRELTIVRPGTVFGKGEHGNFTRLYKGIKWGYFFYTGRKDTIKGGIYVKDLVRFFKYRMIDHSYPGVDIFNCTFEPAYTIEEICEAIKTATGMKRHIFMVPGNLLIAVATVIGPLGGKYLGIHPDRVRKLKVSTNVSGRKMMESGFEFKYTLESAIRDWYKDCNYRGLE